MSKRIKVRRASNGKLSKSDMIMTWLYTNTFTKTEQKEKDKLFRQYYRFYNDGDFPTSVRRSSVNHLKTEEALEALVEMFVAKMLKKYNGRYDRTVLRIENQMEELATLQDSATECESSITIQFWKDRAKFADIKFDTLFAQYGIAETNLRKEIYNAASAADCEISTRYTLYHTMQRAGENNLINDDIAYLIKNVKALAAKMSAIVATKLEELSLRKFTLNT